MEKKYEFNEYQKKKIAERTLLDFNEELTKSKKMENRKIFHKNFRNELDILIHQFYKDGVQFYGFTIDLLYLKEVEKEFIWQNVHEDVESWINYFGYEIELVEFCYISIELHQAKRLKKRMGSGNKNTSIIPHTIVSLDNLPHLHGIIGIRTIIGHNDILDISIKKVFRNVQEFEDIQVKRLYNIKDIKKYWNYCIKENNFKFHRFCHYGENQKYIDIYGTIADNELIYGKPGIAFGIDMFNSSPTSCISGVKTRNPDSKTLVNYLLNLFLFNKNYKINNNKIYQMIPNTKYSWMMIDTLDALKKNNITIFESLKKIYPQQLDEIHTMEIINNDWNKTMDDIIENNNYLMSVEFKQDAIEFLDGIYFINENKFLNFKDDELNLKMKKKNCCIYFAKTYHNLKKPKIWLDSISKTVNNPEEFCIDFARYFHSENLEKIKKKSMVVVGKSNTGKTTLLTNVITNLYGHENIGLIGKGDNFILEQLENKSVIIADEFKYSEANRSQILKLMANELDLINKKGKKKYSFVNKAPILFMFNQELNNIMLNDKAFENRFKHYEFKHEITEYIPEIDEILKKELSEIIIFCNRLYFKKIGIKSILDNKKDKKKIVEKLMLN